MTGLGPSIVVVEPHADDAFLSLGTSIRLWVAEGRSVTVATVYSATPRRGDEAALWADSVGAAWVGLGHVEGGGGLNRTTPVPPLPAPLLPDALTRSAPSIVWPLGLRHPEHRAVAAHANRMLDYAYVETPYQLVRKNGDELRQRIAGRSVVWWARPDRRKWAGVPLFRSQAKFFYYNRPESLDRAPEVVVR